ncbi:hypothetical protein [Chromobacterium phragmitis]|uniref:Bacteriophage Mx8 p63 C-terminal domain-containing protein n=2 Tax=Chromobacterium phragmitis TaxID=2202141 RepID=A0ABV0J217_9NEIS
MTGPARGGGYLDVYPVPELSDEAKKNRAHDPRLDELRAMGMHHCWQKVAAKIGMDAFLAMWRILDAEEQWRHPKGGLELTLRRYRSYEHFQRNSYIRQLAKNGSSFAEIRQRLEESFGINLETKRVREIVMIDL